jgi:DNA-binding LacI/PurR family transcriptional regulator
MFELELAEAILHGSLRPGECLPSLRELLERYNLSFAVVRGVLRTLSQRGLVDLRHGSGTYVAERTQAPLALGSNLPKSEVSARVVGLPLRSDEHVFGKIASLLADGLQSLGHAAMYMPFSLPFEPHAAQQWLEDHREFGPAAVVTRLSSTPLRHFDSILPKSVRRVQLMGQVGDAPAGWHTVGVDIQAASRILINRLLHVGHNRIGFLTHARTVRPQRPEAWRKRMVGHTPWIVALGTALRERDKRGALSIQYGPQYDADKPHDNSSSPLGEASLRRIESWLCHPNRPTAIIGDDFRLYGVKLVAARMGISVPGDLELMGLGNTPYSQACGFSSLSYNEPELARKITELVLAGESGFQGDAQHLKIKPNLVLR